MLARDLETIKSPYNPLIPMETNVENYLREILKHLDIHVTISFYWQLAKINVINTMSVNTLISI